MTATSTEAEQRELENASVFALMHAADTLVARSLECGERVPEDYTIILSELRRRRVDDLYHDIMVRTTQQLKGEPSPYRSEAQTFKRFLATASDFVLMDALAELERLCAGLGGRERAEQQSYRAGLEAELGRRGVAQLYAIMRQRQRERLKRGAAKGRVQA